MKKLVKRQSISKRLGFERIVNYTKNACLTRAKQIQRKLDQGKFKGTLAEKAQSYVYWYRSKAKQIKKAA